MFLTIRLCDLELLGRNGSAPERAYGKNQERSRKATGITRFFDGNLL